MSEHYMRSGPTATSRTAPEDHDGQPDLLSIIAEGPDTPEQALARRDRGMHAAEMNTWTPYKRRAERELERLAASGEPFTSDDIIDRIGLPVASSTSALGPIFGAASKRGDIVCVGATTSRRESRHGGLIRVWVGGEADE